ncbi:MAG: 2-C-methyl-D-erythritol 4-phosphate cytidylyltransferase [Candidatus Margulisiibacteriota bacterium]
MKNIVIIVAGGKGSRMGGPKQFIRIAGKPMLAWTLKAFQNSKLIDGIILIVSKEQLAEAKRLNKKKLIAIAQSGKERQDSVTNGLKYVPGSAEIILIHDGARPAVSQKIIADSINEAKRTGAVVVAVPVKDTIKRGQRVAGSRGKESWIVNETLERDLLWSVQTPQVFKSAIIKEAYAKLKENVTDDGMAVEKMGIQVKIVLGDYENIKVTTPEDLVIMGSILKKKGK